MNPDDFRQWGYRFVDWIAEYLAHPERYAVLPNVKPGEILGELPLHAPEAAESFEVMLRDLDRVIVPGLTHWNHPSFFAYFPNTGSEPGIFGEMITAALNVNGMLWRTSPAATELEERVLDWLRELLGLPADFRGMIFDTASMSTFHALAAARETITERRVRDDGIAGPGSPVLRMYASEQAHSSVEKSAMALGIGRRGLVKIAADSEFRMDVQALETAIERDLREGFRPFAVVATVGTTSTTSIDPVARIADVCAKHNLWLHVDAAYAGSAAIVPELRHILEGCERADSFVTNPHKWLLTPMDLSAFYCRRLEMLRRAFSLTPEYLKTAKGESNAMEYTLQLGRRFRALKLWMVMRHYGVEGLRATIREHIRLAKLFASLVESDARFEVVAPVPFSTVCFRLKAGDAETQALIDRVNASGKIFISHTRLNDKLTARLAIGNARTHEEHVRAAWEIIRGGPSPTGRG
ncbi:MAG TPA: pyridoxal-dependent decarboxylase [Burkholderiales bacterium]|nr:pyridoxal-dependent decarboxylase [Burkholderiales bacterium]